jgi:hypothetical protein
MSSPATQQPTPQLFFQTINSYQRTEALKAAIELEVFTAIGEGNSAIPEIAKRCQTAQRGMRILCDYLCIMGFLAKDGGRYSLTQDSAVFLDKRSQLMAKLVDEKADRNLKILDIAAGHGLYGIAFAKNNPQAEIVALDWAPVLEVAKENARNAAVSDRFSTIVLTLKTYKRRRSGSHATAVSECRPDLSQQRFASGHVEVVQEVRQQHQVVPAAIPDVKRAAFMFSMPVLRAARFILCHRRLSRW